MRKHFLILMLFALLPLAGWAAISVDTKPTLAAGGTYTGLDKLVIATDGVATGAGVYTWWYAITSEGVAPAADAEDTWFSKADLKMKAAGTYYVWYKVISSNPAESPVAPTSIAGNFVIAKASLTLTVNGGTALSKIYGDADPAASVIAALPLAAGAGQLKGDDAISGAHNVLKGTLSLKSYTNGTHATHQYDGTALVGPLAHVITFEGLSADNYEITYADLNMNIKQRPIVNIPLDEFVSGVTFSVNKHSVVYNGQEQKPTYTMTFGGHPVAPNQFTASYHTAATRLDGNIAAEVKNQGTYYVKITGQGNFSGEYYVADEEAAGYEDYIWTINKAPLLFYPENVTKTYDGLQGWFKYNIDANGANVGNPDDENKPFAIEKSVIASGVVPGEVINLPTAAISGGDASAQDAGEYTITLTAPGGGYGAAAANYNILPLQTGKFTISKRNVTLKAKNGLTATYGTAYTYTAGDVTVSGAAQYKQGAAPTADGNTNEATAILALVGATTTTTAETAAGTYPNAVTPTYTASTTAAPNVFKNYNTPTLTPNSLEITGLTVYIAPKAATKVYGTADPTEFDFTTVNLDKATVKTLLGDELALTREEGENVGTYAITAAGPATSGNYSFQYMSNYLTITKANLTIIPTTQILLPVVAPDGKVDLEATLTQTSVTLQGLKSWENEDGDMIPDVIDFTLSFTDAVTDENSRTYTTIDNAIKATAGVDDDTFVANKNKNYTINVATLGTLILSAESHAQDLKLDADGLMAILNANDNAVVNAKIKFASRDAQELPTGTARTWAAEKWNTLVLPFDITIKQLSSTLGYAIVNVVDADHSTTDNVKFQLKMSGKIDANTPFIVKTEDAAANFDKDLNGYVTFNNVTIKKPTSAYPSIKASSDDLGYTFVGAYETLQVDKTQSYLRFLVGNEASWVKIGTSSDNTWNVVPFASYVNLSKAAEGREVTFTMEELDGSTTTIRSISDDAINNVKSKTVDGWYTLNGVKLQGMPTEKGIYINNGKKVVVK